jgi:hypothetical protein
METQSVLHWKHFARRTRQGQLCDSWDLVEDLIEIRLENISDW